MRKGSYLIFKVTALAIACLFVQIGNLFAQVDFQKIDTPFVHELIYVNEKFLPIVSVDIAFRYAGFTADNESQLGLTRLYIDLADSLKFSKDFKNLRSLLERKSIQCSFSADRENFYINLNIKL